jgi:hypothetical protein
VEALRAVYRTALPDAVNVVDAIVAFYPPTVGAFDPTVAEWLVVLNGGGPPCEVCNQ